VKIRLHGTEDECRRAAGRLPALGEVLSVSEPYPDRGASRLVRIYAEIRPGHRPAPADGEGLIRAAEGETDD
jgi:hypothetical protein